MRRFLTWLRGLRSAPQSLFGLMRRPKPPGLEKIYVLRVDFKMTKENADLLDENLKPLREKYGLDFFVLEPGITLSRFDDI